MTASNRECRRKHWRVWRIKRQDNGHVLMHCDACGRTWPAGTKEPQTTTVVLMPRQHGRPQTAVTKAIGKYLGRDA